MWTSGPHAPRIINELQIFRFRLKHQLDYCERVEADDGYIGECPMCCKCPNGPDHLQDQELMNQLGYIEANNMKRFKTFGCIKKHFCHDIKEHGQCFGCLALFVQSSINEGPDCFKLNMMIIYFY